jgi:RecA-family ATPase
MKENENTKHFLTLQEMLKEYETRPRPEFLWSGIKKNSFGLVFGPSKSGKTIFCENLAMSIAIGSSEFFDYQLDGIPKKVLFIGLEEHWENRAERNKMQIAVLNEEQQALAGINYLVQPIDFTSKIFSDKDWVNLEKTIIESNAEVVFIDSITRMNPGKLENSADAEKIMQKLRNICYRVGITLICIHHTPKMGDNVINMDSMKGSSVFAQEADFSIAVTQTRKKKRYMKNIFFRYAADDDNETVKEFSIDSSTWLNLLRNVNETELINSLDRRRSDDKRDEIVNYFNKNTCTAFTTKDLVYHLTSTLQIKDRQVKTYLSELVNEKKIANPSKGQYISTKCVRQNDDEKE